MSGMLNERLFFVSEFHINNLMLEMIGIKSETSDQMPSFIASRPFGRDQYEVSFLILLVSGIPNLQQSLPHCTKRGSVVRGLVNFWIGRRRPHNKKTSCHILPPQRGE